MKWVSVKDGLPKEDEHVLVSGEDGVFRAYLYSDSWTCYPLGSYASDGCVFGITHWMPLPDAPQD